MMLQNKTNQLKYTWDKKNKIKMLDLYVNVWKWSFLEVGKLKKSL